MRPFLLVIIPLTACSLLPDTLNYAGPLRPISGTCDAPSQATLTQRRSVIIFTPASGTLELQGHAQGPTFTAALTLTDPNKHPYPLTFEGSLSGSTITGTYTTPRCRYAATLHLTSD